MAEWLSRPADAGSADNRLWHRAPHFVLNIEHEVRGNFQDGREPKQYRIGHTASLLNFSISLGSQAECLCHRGLAEAALEAQPLEPPGHETIEVRSGRHVHTA